VTETADDPNTEGGRSLDGSSDEELVAFAREGDDSAFEKIFERHRLRVALIAGRFFQDHIEDIVQECFTRVFFALPDFSDQGEGSLRGWVSKIAFNTCYDELRRRGRRREQAISDLSEAEIETVRALSSETADKSIEHLAISRDLANKLLSQLSADDRLVLVLLDVEGLSVTEIARIMDWSTAKVKIRTFRARSDLRKVLKRFL
jgi:RNA polymerase sigma-70 factor (ECF subfamily)